MAYLKILEVFVLSILMDKTEYNFFHKNFKPLKLVTVIILVGNLFFTGYLVMVLDRTYKKLEKACPQVLVPAKQKKT